MAKKKTTSKKKTTRKRGRMVAMPSSAVGKQLVIVESPAKAKTINKYLGPDYVVTASVGHIRDLPPRAPKGTKQPVPGVDLENNFEPTYEVLEDKKSTVTALKKLAKQADDIWFATDLDREGEAIAWHLAELLDVDPAKAKRVLFNAITRTEITRAFKTPHTIDMFKVNAQQARRILDRIVGYQASPLLWRFVARGLSAGRVQSVAVRLIVERERAIDAFEPDERWQVPALLALDPTQQATLAKQWDGFISDTDANDRGPTIKKQNGWLHEHGALRTELVELNGKPFKLGCTATKPQDLSQDVQAVAEAVGLNDVSVNTEKVEKAKGPAKFRRTVTGKLDPATRYTVNRIETKRTKGTQYPPYKTSTLQQAGSNVLSMPTDRTMRIAQALYEGVEVPGEGQVGLITYMRTDSTHLSSEAIAMARSHIKEHFGDRYLPDKPRLYADKKSKNAQEAHEAIRPTDTSRTPESLRGALNEEQFKLYRLIWNQFLSSQMTVAEYDKTTVFFARTDKDTSAVLKAEGKVIVFDGHLRVTGVPTESDEQSLPAFSEGDESAPFKINPTQKFSSPPPRFNEGSLVRELEEDGIGRPSTYAAIIRVIQDRGYVEQLERRFHATALGEVVTDMLMQAFPNLMSIEYTSGLEDRLDLIESEHTDWRVMLGDFYERFSTSLARANEELVHAKMVMDPAPYACPECGAKTCYRFGKNGRFLSCSTYPDCRYAAPVSREGEPLLPEQVDIRCPLDGSQMIKRTGRFGPFIASPNYPEVQFVLNIDKKGRLKLPSPPPLETTLQCPKCEERMLYLREGARGPWLGCSGFPKCRGRLGWATLEDDERKKLELALKNHLKANPMPDITNMDGTLIEAGTPIEGLLVPGGVAELTLHPDAGKEADSPAAAG